MKFPKFHNLLHFVDAIAEYGPVPSYYEGYMECILQLMVKKPTLRTQRQPLRLAEALAKRHQIVSGYLHLRSRLLRLQLAKAGRGDGDDHDGESEATGNQDKATTDLKAWRKLEWWAEGKTLRSAVPEDAEIGHGALPAGALAAVQQWRAKANVRPEETIVFFRELLWGTCSQPKLSPGLYADNNKHNKKHGGVWLDFVHVAPTLHSDRNRTVRLFGFFRSPVHFNDEEELEDDDELDEDEDGANGSLSAHEGEIMCICVYYAEAGVASGRAHAARTALGKLVPMLGPRPATAAGRSQAGSQADFEYVILPARHIISRACCIESRWATTPSRHKCVYSWPTKSKWPEWAGGRANDPALNVEVCAGCEHCA
jgi:hypothetical protein